jgi:hypothetical protein
MLHLAIPGQWAETLILHLPNIAMWFKILSLIFIISLFTASSRLEHPHGQVFGLDAW